MTLTHPSLPFPSSPCPLAAAVLGDVASAISVSVELPSARAAAPVGAVKGRPALVRLHTWRLPAGAALTLVVDEVTSDAGLLRLHAATLQALHVVACDILPRLRPGFAVGGGAVSGEGGKGGGVGGGAAIGGGPSSRLRAGGGVGGGPPGALYASEPLGAGARSTSAAAAPAAAGAAAAAAAATAAAGDGDLEAGTAGALLWPFI
jgi:hypothetical protein